MRAPQICNHFHFLNLNIKFRPATTRKDSTFTSTLISISTPPPRSDLQPLRKIALSLSLSSKYHSPCPVRSATTRKDSTFTSTLISISISTHPHPSDLQPRQRRGDQYDQHQTLHPCAGNLFGIFHLAMLASL